MRSRIRQESRETNGRTLIKPSANKWKGRRKRTRGVDGIFFHGTSTRGEHKMCDEPWGLPRPSILKERIWRTLWRGFGHLLTHALFPAAGWDTVEGCPVPTSRENTWDRLHAHFKGGFLPMFHEHIPLRARPPCFDSHWKAEGTNVLMGVYSRRF